MQKARGSNPFVILAIVAIAGTATLGGCAQQQDAGASAAGSPRPSVATSPSPTSRQYICPRGATYAPVRTNVASAPLSRGLATGAIVQLIKREGPYYYVSIVSGSSYSSGSTFYVNADHLSPTYPCPERSPNPSR
jgi:hypothetical protein